MPNIIEQQDLLKGLPDTRLATLLQNPVADIPPFLVAAEAQRRQAIRQQFAGSEGGESVVDSLTKQLANVPQNISAPSKAPPSIPQTPQMQGVAALQAQQGGGQGSPQGGQQAMRGGGMVQRYQSQGLVERMGSRYGARSPTMQELTTMTPEELAALRKFQSDEKMRRLNQQAQITGGRYGQGIAYQRELLENRIMGPFSEFSSPESVVEDAKRLQDLPTEEEMAQTLETGEPLPSTVRERTFPTLPPGASGGMSMTSQPRAPAEPVEPLAPEPGETPDEFRARYEELLAAQQPSDWEKAQRYFAMAEQFLDPSKTTMQSVAGAGQAFAQSAGEQARAQREAEFNLKKGLLEYDIAERDRLRSAEAERAQREYESLLKREERSVVSAKEAMSYFGTEIKALFDQMKDIDENMMITPEEKKLAKDSIQSQIDSYRLQASFLMKNSGYNTGNAITMDQLRALAGQQ
jgi:hypothetical protein